MHQWSICRNVHPAWIAATFVVAGCSIESQPEVEWDGTVRDSAGVQIVENFGEALWADEERWSLVEELRIGVLEGEPAYQFGNIDDFAALSDGRIAVTDNMAQNLRFFSPNGVHLRTVGRAGSGPKEFGDSRLLIQVGRADTLVVMDWGNLQAQLFAPSGEWLGSWRFPPKDGMRFAGADSSPSGRIINILSPLETPDMVAADTLDAVVIRDVWGNIQDTLLWVSSPRAYLLQDGKTIQRFYVGLREISLGPDGGLVTARTDQYRLMRYDPNGRLERIVNLHRDRTPIDNRERMIFMERVEAMMTKWPASPAWIADWKSTVRFEEYYPAFTGLLAGPRGTLWLEHVRPLSDLSQEEIDNTITVFAWPLSSSDWDVFDREGRYLGVVQMPEELREVRFYGDKLYGIWEDELDVQQLVVMRIDGLPPPAGG